MISLICATLLSFAPAVAPPEDLFESKTSTRIEFADIVVCELIGDKAFIVTRDAKQRLVSPSLIEIRGTTLLLTLVREEKTPNPAQVLTTRYVDVDNLTHEIATDCKAYRTEEDCKNAHKKQVKLMIVDFRVKPQ